MALLLLGVSRQELAPRTTSPHPLTASSMTRSKDKVVATLG